MNTTQRNTFALTALAASLLLTGCGGGGGGTTVAVTPGAPVTVAPPPVVVAPPVVAPTQPAAPVVTYAAGSQELAAFNALNTFRSQVGLPLLTQTPALDMAARSHLAYVLKNSTLNGGTVDMNSINAQYGVPQFHIEDLSLAFATGVTASDRGRVAGYPQSTDTFVGESGYYAIGKGGAANATLLDAGTVFHRNELMSQAFKDIGFAVGTDSNITIVTNPGWTGRRGTVAANFVGVYPSDQLKGVPVAITGETPNPAPDVAQVGYPISLAVRDGSTVSVTTFTVTAADGSVVPTRTLTKASNANTMLYLQTSVAFALPTVLLKAGTTYTVSFVGTVDGAPLVKTWTFTTA